MKQSKDYFAEEGLPEAVQPSVAVVRSLVGQKAIVTGANSGIGRGVALALGHAGADVVVNYVSRPEEAQKVVAAIEASGARAFAFKADVSQEAEVQAMFAKAVETFGAVDIMVSNAGLQKDAPFEELSVAAWDLVMNVNLKGQFLCAREAVRTFKKQGVRKAPNGVVSCAAGKIICMSSVHDIIPWAGHVNYAASKGGVMMMMKSIAQEVAPWRIRVNSISPGAVRTPINEEAWSTRDAYNSLMTLVPYKRIGEPADIGRAAVWLASDDSDYVTGANSGIGRAVALALGHAGADVVVNYVSR
ncbi:MAG TPA: glucose 1-dehydrogenase, partial [Polyangia bacterium]|nr:glucose 1-dehydrogenase [Polyangia bacterium]